MITIIPASVTGIIPGLLSRVRNFIQFNSISLVMINEANTNIPNEVIACTYFRKETISGFEKSLIFVDSSLIGILKIKIPVEKLII